MLTRCALPPATRPDLHRYNAGSMTSKKKAAIRKRSSGPTKRSSSRFLRAFVASAATAFGAATCALNPQFRHEFSQFRLPGFEQIAPVAAPSGAIVQTGFPRCRQFFPGGRPPAVPAAPALRELCFSSFAILHSGRTKTPVFVAERLNRQMLSRGRQVERTDRFYAEARLPAAERAELADYQGSGYSRGHMAPAGDMSSAEAMAQSFSLANMVPQDQRHNAGAWSKIEQDTRKYVMRATGDVYVFTGPLYAASKNVQAGRVAVPTHLFKLVYDSNTGRSWVHWQANSQNAKAGQPISYQEFVRRTGLNLLRTGP